MTLPADNSAWPPANQTRRYSQMRTNSTWYGGDPVELRALYGGEVVPTRKRQSLAARAYDWFWGQADPSAPDDKIHVPVAQDIAQMSSELLFAAPPRFVVQPREVDATTGKPTDAHAKEVEQTQRRLDAILDGCQFQSVLLAAAETSAALGAAGLRISYDAATMEMPVITRVDADAIVPEYRFGQLVAVTLWHVVKRVGDTYWYLLEEHTPGQVEHALYKGERGNIGKRQPLDSLPETAPLVDLANENGVVPTVAKGMTATSIPNLLPDPLDRMNNAGRSDYSPGTLSIFDAIDEAMTSWMRDIEDGRSRLLVADYMLTSNGAGKGVQFDTDQHIFTTLKRQPGEQGDPPIDQVQFDIRVDEHMRTVDYLINKAIKSCGYNTDSELGEGGGEMTATEYEGRARRSLNTRAKKLRYWQAVEPLLETLLKIDAEQFKSGITPLPVKMEVAAPVQSSDKSLAETVEIVERAKAASLEVKVRMLHPDWDDPSIDAEVAAIRAEQGVADPEMLPSGRGFGAPLPGDEIDTEGGVVQ